MKHLVTSEKFAYFVMFMNLTFITLMRKFWIVLLLANVWVAVMAQGASLKITEEHKQQAKEIVAKMTLEEKIDFIGGYDAFSIRAIERLGIPEVKMADGPQGVRNNTISTQYSCGIAATATWNRSLVNEFGIGMGRDCKARGVAIILGPGVNIYRSPLCGRNFEYFGEDPYLASETAKQYILGVLSQGVAATIKHFAVNNQEYDRHHVSTDVDERTLHEIYFPTFRKAVTEAGVAAVMDSYNPINGVHASENPYTNIEVLRNLWGFDGILMSDWDSSYSGFGCVTGGLDIEMPSAKCMNRKNLMPLLVNGVISEADIDLKCQHIIQTCLAMGFYDRPMIDVDIALDNPMSAQTALYLAREAVVMLKNDTFGRKPTLPISKGNILVVGPFADSIPMGGGSGEVQPFYKVSTYKGLCDIYGTKKVKAFTERDLYKDVAIEYKVDFFLGKEMKGQPVLSRTESRIGWNGKPCAELPANNFSAKYVGKMTPERSGTMRLTFGGDDGYRLYFDGRLLGENWGNHSYEEQKIDIEVVAGKTYQLVFEYYQDGGGAKARVDAGFYDDSDLNNVLEWADHIVFCAGFDMAIEGEGHDRPFELPKDQIDLFHKFTGKGKDVTMVINSGGGLDFSSWSDKANAILMAWYPGQCGGQAVAEILTGKVVPSGKLPITLERRLEDNPTNDFYYPDKSAVHQRVLYGEGIFVGYRGYDRTGVEPLYPFGFGLSYSSFEYSDLKASVIGKNRVKVEFTVTNTGKYDAAEVSQVYVHDVEASVLRPLKELKGYEKVSLKKGESRRVTIELDEDSFSFWDIDSDRFVVEPGMFEILVGGSSASLVLKTTVTL